ncbi:MAG: hypothetical protein EXQ57_11245 [Bryobacterales bacterium]|nr:hypothetical protein [Bryobacterales bacterium]
MKWTSVLVVLACALFAAPVNRGLIAAVEVSMNKRVEALFPGEQYLLLGHTHGVYLDGVGCVFTTRINLAEGPGLSPFRQQLPESERAALRKKKVERLPVLRTAMRDMLVSAAIVMDPVPSSERMVLSISLLNYPHEDVSGLPTQIVMQAERRTLLGFLTPKSDKAALEAAIQTREY